MPLTRRKFLKLAGGAGLILSGCGPKPEPQPQLEDTSPLYRVIVIGGGFAGAAAAKYLRIADKRIHVLLLDKNPLYISALGSNRVYGGLYPFDSLSRNYNSLQSRYGVEAVQAEISAIDPVSRTVQTNDGRGFHYDRLIMAPGAEPVWNGIKGYNDKAVNVMPHAWQPGAQLKLFHEQLLAMKDGGVAIIAVQDGVLTCPAAAYERTGMVAHYLKQHKPKSKLLLLTAADEFPFQRWHEETWRQHYGYGTDNALIEWIPGKADGRVVQVDLKHKIVINEYTEEKGDTVNLIPSQQVGAAARLHGLADASGWCPVRPGTWESTLTPGIHVIGDAAADGIHAKNAAAANAVAKLCAAAVAALLKHEEPPQSDWEVTEYSLLDPAWAVAQATRYAYSWRGKLKTETDPERRIPVSLLNNWYAKINSDCFG